MRLWLGIDGGGSGCRAAVADAAGTILGQAEAGPANIASDFEGALANILAASRTALERAGAHAEAIFTLRAGLGLAGVNAAGRTERLQQALPFAHATIATDAVAGVKGALGGADGIVAAIGTGSVFAVQRAGRVRQIGGWGLVLGDEASGAWIGRAVMARALRALDGFVPMTPLLATLLDEAGSAEALVSQSLSARPADFAALAARIADSDDPAAQSVMAAATQEINAAIALLQQGAALPVVFLGGLGPAFAARLAARWQIRPAQGTALDGALALAREGGP